MNHQFLLRNIDPELWQRVKDRATAEDRNISAVLRAFLRVYASHGYHVIETFDRRHTKEGA